MLGFDFLQVPILNLKAGNEMIIILYIKTFSKIYKSLQQKLVSITIYNKFLKTQ